MQGVYVVMHRSYITVCVFFLKELRIYLMSNSTGRTVDLLVLNTNCVFITGDYIPHISSCTTG